MHKIIGESLHVQEKKEILGFTESTCHKGFKEYVYGNPKKVLVALSECLTVELQLLMLDKLQSVFSKEEISKSQILGRYTGDFLNIKKRNKDMQLKFLVDFSRNENINGCKVLGYEIDNLYSNELGFDRKNGYLFMNDKNFRICHRIDGKSEIVVIHFSSILQIKFSSKIELEIRSRDKKIIKIKFKYNQDLTKIKERIGCIFYQFVVEEAFDFTVENESKARNIEINDDHKELNNVNASKAEISEENLKSGKAISMKETCSKNYNKNISDLIRKEDAVDESNKLNCQTSDVVKTYGSLHTEQILKDDDSCSMSISSNSSKSVNSKRISKQLYSDFKEKRKGKRCNAKRNLLDLVDKISFATESPSPKKLSRSSTKSRKIKRLKSWNKREKVRTSSRACKKKITSLRFKKEALFGSVANQIKECYRTKLEWIDTVCRMLKRDAKASKEKMMSMHIYKLCN